MSTAQLTKTPKLINDDKLMCREHFVAGQPHAEWKILREQCPVYWSEPTGFRPYWSITKYKDLVEVERQPDIFINAPRWVIMPAAFDEYMEENFGHMNNLLLIVAQMDAPQHTKHRELMQPWFLPKALAKRQATIEGICNHYFDKLRERGQEGEMDFASDLAWWYPLRVACWVLGSVEEDDAEVLRIAEEVLTFQAPEPGGKTGFEKCLDFCNRLAAMKREAPADDFATYLVQSEIDGKPLESKELLAHYLTVATAGHDTTSSSITNGIKALIENPDQLQAVREDPSLIKSAANEMIRWTSPTVQFARTATRDYVLNGQLIKKGDSLALCFSSGNRDADAFEEPDSFNVRRSPNNHLAFGSGVHSCLGSQLARLEVQCFLKTFLERIEHIELTGPTPWFPANLVTRIEHMPVHYRFYK
jgi:cytochrome P450